MKTKNNRAWQQRASVFLGILLVVATISGAILPLLRNSLTNQQAATSPTDTPVPTVPAPPDTSLIAFTQPYLHPSGLFTATIPTGWTVTSELNTSGEALVTMQNPAALSVIEIRLIRPTSEILLDTPQNMGAYFTADWLTQSWRQYTNPREDQRRVDGANLIMDFTLSQRGQTYAARQMARTDGTWIYAARVVTPSNATDVMQFVLDGVYNSIQVIPNYVGQPIEWHGYFDNVNKFMIRFPSTWALVDAADGAPASILGENAQLRVEASASGIASEDAASAYVSGLRSGITVLSVNEVTVQGVAAYRVAYSLATLDGETQSGLVLILNDGTTNYIANVLLTDVSATDLNLVDVAAVGVAQNIIDARNVLESLALFPSMNIE
jgi:hypothetical protein